MMLSSSSSGAVFCDFSFTLTGGRLYKHPHPEPPQLRPPMPAFMSTAYYWGNPFGGTLHDIYPFDEYNYMYRLERYDPICSEFD